MIDCRGVNHHACSVIQNVSKVAFSDKLPDRLDKTVIKVVGTDYLTKSVDHVSLENRMCDPLSAKQSLNWCCTSQQGRHYDYKTLQSE